MSKYVKLTIGIIVFLVVIIGAKFLYDSLSKKYKSGDILVTEKQEDIEESTEKNQTSTEEKQKYIDFSMYDYDGKEIKLSSFEGKPMVINFWASWCGPCKTELPDFQDAYETYGEEVEFLMVNLTGGRETKEAAKKYIDKEGFTFPVYYDLKQDATLTYSIYSIPTTLFIGEDGVIEAGAQGMLDRATLEKGISMIYNSKNKKIIKKEKLLWQ